MTELALANNEWPGDRETFSMRILIAEDDLTSRTLLARILKKQGHEVVATVNGMEAWVTMQQHDAPLLAVLDWMMPVMDGIEVCRRIRALETDQPPYIIMLTSRDEKADIIAGLEAGADDYLVKPYDPGEFRARLNVGRRMVEMQAKLLEARDGLAHEATHDPLTGIHNRRAILEVLARELSRAKRTGKTVSLGLCDLDHFKQINDLHGHQTGDEVLCGFARIVQNNLRAYDLVGRYGGDEFLVITPELGDSEIERAYERLRDNVAQSTVHTKAGAISITMSIGVSTGTGGDTVDALLAEADIALYEAKKGGRNSSSYAGFKNRVRIAG
jgi:two-component system, cell cycle response regulator